MTLPLLLSVPHAGLLVPDAVKPYCILTLEQIIKDGDEGAAEIYALAEHVQAFVTTDIARAIVDMNRADDDRRPDGVVKTHTCWNDVVYDPFPPEEILQQLLREHYYLYHQRLDKAYDADIRLAVDCHTMAAEGPPIGPGAGKRRPAVCLGDAHGKTLPNGWMDRLAACFREVFDDVNVNEPFAGGYITRTHGRRRPWVQLELSRDPSLSNSDKRERVLRALTKFCSS